MEVFHQSKDFKLIQEELKNQGKSLGFVPTMGALHQGHISLIELSKSYSDKTIASIFVNPTQFNDPKDFEKYPKTIEQDIAKLKAAGCDYLYLPDLQDIYPNGILENFTAYEIGKLESIFEGKYRPGHFQGVCLVVDLLLKKVKPDYLFLGEKDFQQVAVIRKMIDNENFIPKPKIYTGKTIRENSGLAMSSRNKRLSEKGILNAKEIFAGFLKIQEEINLGNRNIQNLKENFSQDLFKAGFTKIDYIAFSKIDQLEEIKTIDQSFRILFAGFLEEIRLIDNYEIHLP